MAFGFDGGPHFLDFAVRADEERAAHDAHELSAHELFLLPGSESFDGFVIGIAEQGKIEFLFCFERGLGLDGIGTHSKDGHTELIELLFCVTKLGRFDGSTGSVGLGIEKDEDTMAFKVA